MRGRRQVRNALNVALLLAAAAERAAVSEASQQSGMGSDLAVHARPDRRRRWRKRTHGTGNDRAAINAPCDCASLVKDARWKNRGSLSARTARP
jgi:hypothetical protein